MTELQSEHFKTERYIGEGHAKSGAWVFETTENGDLYAYAFDSKEEAEEYIEDTENKCQLLWIGYISGGAYLVKVEDHT